MTTPRRGPHIGSYDYERLRGFLLIRRGELGEAFLRVAPGRRLAPASGPRVVVSLTTYPARIGAVWLTLESLLRQRTPPHAVRLVLARSEFPDATIPARLQDAVARGVEIQWVDGNTRSYKKLLPVLAEEPDALVVTADDDVLYPSWWLERLLVRHREVPDAVVGHRGVAMQRDDAGLTRYATWPGATRRTPGADVLLTGMGGILYPPGSLAPGVADVEAALRLCPNADDVWFKAAALAAGTRTTTVDDHKRDFPPSRSATQLTALRVQNRDEGANDGQIAAAFAHFGLA